MTYLFSKYIDKKDLSTLINSITPYEDMGFTVNITMYLKNVVTNTDEYGITINNVKYDYIASYPYADLDLYMDGFDMKNYIEHGLHYHIQIINRYNIETNLDKYNNFSVDLFEKLKSKFKKFTWMRDAINELFLVPIEHKFKMKWNTENT